MIFDEFTGEGRCFEDKRVEFFATKSVLVKRDLFTFTEGSPVTACKYTNFSITE